MTQSTAQLQTSEKSDSDEVLQQFLTFAVDDEQYGIDLLKIREIKGWTETTRLPNTPKFMKGIMNLRGAVIPIFDLKGRFGMGESVPSEKHVVIIVAVGKRLVGILVDSVSDIVEATAGQVRPAPQVETKLDKAFVEGLISLDEKMVILLNIESLFSIEALRVVMGNLTVGG
jgi:purine-binding chemotaxis protein CheW